jgi:hypothetical protein
LVRSISPSRATPGRNNILTFRATDRAGLFTEVVRTVIRDTQAPVLNVLMPPDGHITSDANLAVSGTVSDLTAVTVNVNGAPHTVQSGSFSGNVALSMGLNVLSFTATDAATNATTIVRQVTRSDNVIPPDPSTVAKPEIARSRRRCSMQPTSSAEAIPFRRRRGWDDQACTSDSDSRRVGSSRYGDFGVEISILDHPEYGKTYAGGWSV